MIRTILIVLSTITFGPSPSAAQQPDEIAGRWQGAILVAGVELSMIVNFRRTPDALAATIDIPQQGAADVPLSNVSYDSPNVHFELPAGPGLAVFDGQVAADSMDGSFTQAGFVGSFWLKRGAEAEAAEAEEAPPYAEVDVSFSSGDVRLGGTLTLPDHGGPHPALVLITGSGPQNRDEDLFGFKLFRVIADHLTRSGFAVLRYDDRGVGESTGTLASATTEDLAGDVVAAIDQLRAREDIDASRIGLLGHSEGGIIAPLVATRSSDVAFLVLLAPSTVTGERILLAQGELIARAEGATEAALAGQAELQRKVFATVRTDSGWAELEQEIAETVRAGLNSIPAEQRAAIGDLDAYVETTARSQIAAVRTPWFAYFLDYDPAEAFERVTVPLLVLFGELDLQVPPDLNAEPLREALDRAGNEDYTVSVLPGANHLFQKARTGSPSEYASLEKRFIDGFLEMISEWLATVSREP